MTENLLKREDTYKAEISSATNAIRHILNMHDVLLSHKKRMISEMIWKITEGDGLNPAEKITGLLYKKNITYISESVKKRRDVGNYDISDLRHEHVYMRKGLVDRLLSNPMGISNVLKNTIGCVVTEKEHDSLPHKGLDGWDRYKKAKIRIWNTRTKTWELDYKDFN
jgi:hypothetical protein